MREFPLVSLLFPLYKSAENLKIIVKNIDAVDYPNVEFLFGDRHGLDDTILQLKERYKNDVRFKYFETKDGQDWRVNTNNLIAHSNGDFYRFMPHDDLFPVCGLREMVKEMQGHPECIVVYSPVKHFFKNDPEKKMYGNRVNERYFKNEFLDTLSMNFPIKHAGSFRGLTRLNKIRELQLEIIESTILCDRYYLFGLKLLGTFRFIQAGSSIKQMHDESVSHKWINKMGASKIGVLKEAYTMHQIYLKRTNNSRAVVVLSKCIITFFILKFTIKYSLN